MPILQKFLISAALLMLTSTSSGCPAAGHKCTGFAVGRGNPSGAAAGLQATTAKHHRQAGQLPHAKYDFRNYSPRIWQRRCGGTGVDQSRIRAHLQRVRRMPRGEDRSLHRSTRGAHTQTDADWKRVCGAARHRCGQRQTHVPGLRTLRFACDQTRSISNRPRQERTMTAAVPPSCWKPRG